MIEVSHLCKQFRMTQQGEGFRGQVKSLFAPEYRTIKAVDDISYTIQPGEIVGYLGPNGAGKSTTIKLLTGVLTPSSGTVKVHGISPHNDPTSNACRAGVVYGQRSQLWWDLPLVEKNFLRHFPVEMDLENCA